MYSETYSIHGGQGEGKEGGRPLQVGRCRFHKQGNLQCEACLGQPQDKQISPTYQILSFIEALTGFSHLYSPDGLKTTSLPPGYILEAVSGSGESRQNPHSKDRGQGEEPLVAGVQLPGPLGAASLREHSPTLPWCWSSSLQSVMQISGVTKL